MLRPLELTCEYAVDPLGIDVAQPRFSWILTSSRRGQMQSAYHILVASSRELLEADTPDKWDSGKVISEESVNVGYQGSSLDSGQECWWKVRVWDNQQKPGACSAAAKFEMGLLSEKDWVGEWIGGDISISAPLLRKEFDIAQKVKHGRIYISGLGWYELFLNGKRVGAHVLDPATTDYTKRVLYATYDITDLLKDGPNAIGVMLGNGWYCEPDWEKPYGDSPRLLAQMNIEFSDGAKASIATDQTWRVSSGPITRNNLYGGETYDARLEQTGWSEAGYDDSGWNRALKKENPGGKLVSQLMPPIKVNKTIRPVSLSNPKAGIYVYDMGQLFGGWGRLRVRGPRGSKVTIKYSERVDEESGLLDLSCCSHRLATDRSAIETDYYILKGDPAGEVYEPRFTYHPVRYVQVEGYPGEPTLEDLHGMVVYSAVDMSGDFHCGNPLINRIHENVTRTLTNELYGMPLDCLHREHWAWTDPGTVAGTLYPRKHMPLFWAKWLQDIADAQDERGAIPPIAPNYRRWRKIDPAWGGNYPILLWYLHQYYGDTRLLKEHYGGMKRWADYLTSIADGYLVKEGLYSDHMLPGESPGKEEFISSETPPALLWSGYYYRGASIVAQAAEVLSQTDDVQYYRRLANNIKRAFNREWLKEDTDHYAGGSQTANLFPLALGIVPQANEKGVVRNIARDIVEKYGGHLHTGNIGTACMIETLTGRGLGNVMYQVATKATYPGWGYMVKEGATTIWESWGLDSTGGHTESMIMWAVIDRFFYNDLAGIREPDYYGPGYMTPGFGRIHIQPHILGDLEHASASIKTVRGIISSSWQKKEDTFTLEITLPVNSRAKVSVPKMELEKVTIKESGNTIWKDGSYVGGTEGISGASETTEHVTFDIGSGSYCLELSGTRKTVAKVL